MSPPTAQRRPGGGGAEDARLAGGSSPSTIRAARDNGSQAGGFDPATCRLDLGGRSLGPCPACGVDPGPEGAHGVTFGLSGAEGPRLCSACAEAHFPDPLLDGLQALDDLDSALLLADPRTRLSILAAAAGALGYLAKQYAPSGALS